MADYVVHKKNKADEFINLFIEFTKKCEILDISLDGSELIISDNAYSSLCEDNFLLNTIQSGSGVIKIRPKCGVEKFLKHYRVPK